MEYQFTKYAYPYLRTVTSGKQIKEEVQEIRLPEAFPDIGRVLDCWGQVMIRSKEWRGDDIRVSGGVMVWALYVPEDGNGVRSVESWIPFQMRWELPDSCRDGSICVMPFLQNLDARSISARKLMVRCGVCLVAEALEPAEAEAWQQADLLDDVCMLTRTYPLEIPLESGEKLIQIEETLEAPATLSDSAKILRYDLNPSVAEQKIMANRLVFRGTIKLHMLFSDGDSRLIPWDTEVSFSQYTDLDKDYSGNATSMILPMLTAAELERNETGQIKCQCSFAAQYLVFDRKELKIVEDAYCPGRAVTVQRNPIRIPVRLDAARQMISVEDAVQAEEGTIADVSWCMDSPESMQLQDDAQVTIGGQFKILCYDGDGRIQSTGRKRAVEWNIPSDSDNRMILCPTVSDFPSGEFIGDRISARCGLAADLCVLSEQEFQMVTSVSLGEEIAQDPSRPALILCRADGAGLWDIAKRHGSTVEAIMVANGLTNEPEPDRLLLIPIA